MQPSLDTWTIIFLVAALQGFLLSFLIWKRSPETKILAGVVLVFSFTILFYVAYWTHYLSLFPRWVGLIQGSTYITGPLFLAFTQKRHLSSYGWHFVPFLVYVTYFISLPALPASLRTHTIHIQIVLQSLHLLSYALIAMRETRRSSGSVRTHLAALYVIYAFTFPAYYVLVWTDLLQIEYDYLISFAACMCIYMIGYSSFATGNPHTPKHKYDKSRLSPTAAQAILSEIKKFMVDDRGFLNNDLKLHQLSEELSISANHISQVINDLEGCNFTDFINRYRIEEAKKLILDRQKSYKIIQIAYLSGFNNKATFNSAFKKFVGMPPSRFKAQHLA